MKRFLKLFGCVYGFLFIFTSLEAYIGQSSPALRYSLMLVWGFIADMYICRTEKKAKA